MPAIIPDLTAKMCDFLQLDVAALGRIRKTAEDPPRVSIYDVIGVVTGTAPADCKHTWDRLLSKHPEILPLCQTFKFEGQGQRETPVCEETRLSTIMQLLLGLHMARLRAGLDPPGKRRKVVDDLYVMRYVDILPDVVKVGRSRDAERRRANLEASQDFHVELVAVFPQRGHLESIVHERLAEHRSSRGTGTEWFKVTVQQALDVVMGAIASDAEQVRSASSSAG